MQQQAEKENWNEEDHLEVRRKDALKKRYVMMGLATVGGGLVIGLSAGILAPMIGVGLAAGLTTIGIGGTAPFLGGVVLCDLFLILIADSSYDARSRVLLERVGKSLQIDWLEIRKFEKRVTDALEMQQQADKENWNEEDHLEVRRKDALKKRYVMMGLATVGGGLVIGLSAGILAPMIGVGLAAGLTTIGIGGTAPFLGGIGGAAIITTAAASSGGIVGVRAANRRTGAVKTFEYRPLHNNKRVNLIVTVSGWMTGKVDDVRLPFSTVDPIMGDLYSVLWEPEMLRSTGDTINILATEALTSGVQQVSSWPIH
ncbi:lipase MIL1 like protein [Verticillium longisporum]|nr:lipase MIL1 like protein [Verticillium longisporum]